MKLLTIKTGTSGHPGVLTPDNLVLDLARIRTEIAFAHLVPSSTRDILEAGPEALELLRRVLQTVNDLPEARRRFLREAGILTEFARTPLLAPIPDARLVLSAAANYGKHVKEFSAVSLPRHPTAFIKTTESLSAHGARICVPPQCPSRVDFEGEMCFVFGRTCHNVSEADAMSHVAGYMIANDVSARDWAPEVFSAEERFEIIRAWERNVMGKNLPGFTPCGPYVVTSDEIPDPHDLRIRTTLNGELMQDGSTSELLFKVPQLISYFSRWYRFRAGDIFTTGSPAGVGAQRQPPVFMKPGDVVEVEISGLGKLSNRLEAAAAQVQ